MERKALKLALEVMQINLTLLKKVNPYKGQEDLVSDSLDLTHKAIATVKEALAQPVQEPYGYDWSMLEAAQESLREHMARIHELEAALAQPAPPREWVGLTDEEINALLPEADGAAEVDVKRVEVQPGLWGEECSLADAWSLPLMLQFLNAYEAKLKEKNI